MKITNQEIYGLEFALRSSGFPMMTEFDVKEDEQSVELLAYVKENGIEKAVPHYTGIEAGSRMYDEIIKYYNELKGKYNR